MFRNLQSVQCPLLGTEYARQAIILSVSSEHAECLRNYSTSCKVVLLVTQSSFTINLEWFYCSQKIKEWIVWYDEPALLDTKGQEKQLNVSSARESFNSSRVILLGVVSRTGQRSIVAGMQKAAAIPLNRKPQPCNWEGSVGGRGSMRCWGKGPSDLTWLGSHRTGLPCVLRSQATSNGGFVSARHGRKVNTGGEDYKREQGSGRQAHKQGPSSHPSGESHHHSQE